MPKTKWFSLLVCLSLVIGFQTNVSANPARPQVQAPRDPEIIHQLITGDPAQFFSPQNRPAPRQSQVNVPNPPPPGWTRLAFQSFRYDNWDIYATHPSGAGEIRLTSETSQENYPSIAKGGDWVAFSSNRGGTNDIYAENTNGSGLSPMVASAANEVYPVWSPDNTRLAFQSDQAGNFDIYVLYAGSITRLTSSSAYEGEPTWSPDGSQMAFVSNRSGKYELWVMNANGSNPHQLTTNANAATPAWSPLGDRIAYASDDNNDGFYTLYVVNIDGSIPVKAINYQYNTTDFWNPSWSPDGKWLAFVETNWISISGTYYWNTSNVTFYNIADPYPHYYQPFSDNLIWKISWATTDITPPEPCTIILKPYQPWESFFVSWSAVDAPAGVSTYDVQWRDFPDGAWKDLLIDTHQSAAIFPGKNEHSYAFRCRGRDAARNYSAWETAPSVSTQVETAYPSSQVVTSSSYVQGSQVTLTWSGNAPAGGVTSYDIFVRDGDHGDWTAWLRGATATTAVFSGTFGHTYYFRSQAHDGANHTQPWQPDPQAVVSFYSNNIQTQDNVGLTLPAALKPERVALGPMAVFVPLVSKPLVQAAPALPSDWLTLGNDDHHSGYAPNQTSASRYALAWSKTMGSGSQVVVADGVLVVVQNYWLSSGIFAYDLDTGRQLWHLQLPGIESISPASISNGAVFFQDEDNLNTYMNCLDLYTGQILWQTSTDDWTNADLHPLIAGQKIYANFGNFIYDESSGALLIEDYHYEEFDHWVPAYADDKIYTWIVPPSSPFNFSDFHERDATTGAVNWTLTLPWGFYSYSMNTAPVISQRTAFVVSMYYLDAIDLDAHAVRWSIPGDYRDTLPAVAGDVVYALTGSTLEARQVSTGTLLGSFTAPAPLIHSPVVSGANVYVSTDTTTYLLDRATLQVKWTAPHGGWLSLSNGYLIIAGADGTLSVYREQER